MSIYDEIGGAAAVSAAVEIFYAKVMGDSLLSPFFDHLDMETQTRKQENFLTLVLRGKLEGAGPYMRKAHAPLVAEKGLTDVHFDAVAEHLVSTLEALMVPHHLISQIMGPVAALRDAVLNRETALAS